MPKEQKEDVLQPVQPEATAAPAAVNAIVQAQRQPRTLTPKDRKNRARSGMPVPRKATPNVRKVTINSDSLFDARIDSLYATTAQRNVVQAATNMARQVKSQVLNSNAAIENYQREKVIFEIQWHKIIASSFMCIAMFLIGAPLGAIIKKGGLGVPFLISILFFIIYYLLNMQGEKLAKQGVTSPMIGIWAADFILLIIGIVFLRQARVDARLFDADAYRVMLDRLRSWYAGRRLQSKPAT